jgi:hypothetical protein
MTASNRDRDIVEQLIGGASVSEIGRAHGLTSPGASLRLIDRALDIALPSLDLHQQGRPRCRRRRALVDRGPYEGGGGHEDRLTVAFPSVALPNLI